MGIVDSEGKIIKKEIYDYPNEIVSLEDIFEPINAFIDENMSDEIESIGIGIPGISTDTLVNYTCNLPLRDIEIRDYIKTYLPIYVSNDANCAAIAEYQVADGKLFSNYALVTFGTGIGAGIIVNGALYNGTTGAAGEIGHMVIEKEGIPCKCGRRGCYEKYASVTALKRMTKLTDIKEVFYLSERNEVIQRVLDDYLENVAEGQFLTKELGVTYYDPEDNMRKASNEELIKTKVEKRLERWCKKHKFLSKFKFIVNWVKKSIERKIRKTQKKKKTSSTFPSHFPYIHKSDEERVENMPWILENTEPWLKTLKIDGTSSTCILERLRGKNKFEFYVLSRNVRQETPDQKCYHESNVYWEVENKYHIRDMLQDLLNKHPEWNYICIQGESAGISLTGSPIQGDPHKFKELRFFGFNFIDSIQGRWDSREAKKLVAQYGIEWVPIIDEHYILPNSMEEFKKSAEGECEAPGGHGLREGYVYRKIGEPTLSFKNINNQYLLGQK